MAEHGADQMPSAASPFSTAQATARMGPIWWRRGAAGGRQAFVADVPANFAYVCPHAREGAAAIKHPLRMADGVPWAYDLSGHPAAAAALAPLGDEAEARDTMIAETAGRTPPVTSSVGRLFDAASALLSICTKPSYEGEGAILLEAAMETAGARRGRRCGCRRGRGRGRRGRAGGEGALRRHRREEDRHRDEHRAGHLGAGSWMPKPTFHASLDDLAAGGAGVRHQPPLPRCHGLAPSS